MTPKLTWVEKLKRWERAQDEALAKALMSPPELTTILKAIRFPSVVIIMGGRGTGKSALAHEIMRQLHNRRKIGGTMFVPKVNLHKPLHKLLPAWIKIVSSLDNLPIKSITLIDEASQVAHARRTQSGDAVELDNLIGISRQRKQIILFLSHHSRKLDPNLIHDSDMIIWKEPTKAHVLFERDEMQLFAKKAWDFFANVHREKDKVKLSYVMDLHKLKFSYIKNRLPDYWKEDLSNIFQTVGVSMKG